MARAVIALAALAVLGTASAGVVHVPWDSCGTRNDRLKTTSLTFSATPGLRAGATAHIHTTGTTMLHAPLVSGAWQIRIYEEGHAHPVATSFGDLLDALHFTNSRDIAYTMDVSYTLPRATTTGNYTVSLMATDQQHAVYSCIEVRYMYEGEVEPVTFDNVDAEAVAVTQMDAGVGDGPHFWSCGSGSDLLQNLQIKITPSTPVKGSPVTIAANGKLTSGVTGGTVSYTASLDGIKLISKTEDLCKLLSHTSQKCPLAAGPASIGITETIPSWAPSGNYSATAHATDASGAQITCLQGWFKL